MKTSTLVTFSNDLADAVAAVAPSVVQVQGRRAPASGVVFAQDAVLTTMRALGREDQLSVRAADGRTLAAELVGWDLATHLAVLRAPELGLPAATPATEPARVGHLALAVARSWSNALTASAGIVAVIGGPLPTGRGRAIDRVLRTTAPMHRGFAGGAFVDAAGAVLGIATAAEIRGLGVVIPSDIAWRAAEDLLKHGRPKRGYLGLAGQAVQLAGAQREAAGVESALLVAGVVAASPAAEAGLLVGDVIVTFDGQPISSAENLLDALSGQRVGQAVTLKVLRGGKMAEVNVTVGERA